MVARFHFAPSPVDLIQSPRRAKFSQTIGRKPSAGPVFLTKPSKGRVLRNRVPAVAVDAGGILPSAPTAWRRCFFLPPVFLNPILAGTGYYKPCWGGGTAPPAAELFTTSPRLPAGLLGAVMNNVGNGIRMLRVGSAIARRFRSCLEFPTFARGLLLGFHARHRFAARQNRNLN